MKKFLHRLFESKKSKEIRIQVALGLMHYECYHCDGTGRLIYTIYSRLDSRDSKRVDTACYTCKGVGKLKDPYLVGGYPWRR